MSIEIFVFNDCYEIKMQRAVSGEYQSKAKNIDATWLQIIGKMYMYSNILALF